MSFLGKGFSDLIMNIARVEPDSSDSESETTPQNNLSSNSIRSMLSSVARETSDSIQSGVQNVNGKQQLFDGGYCIVDFTV